VVKASSAETGSVNKQASERTTGKIPIETKLKFLTLSPTTGFSKTPITINGERKALADNITYSQALLLKPYHPESGEYHAASILIEQPSFNYAPLSFRPINYS
jgi:hypothetical protein